LILFLEKVAFDPHDSFPHEHHHGRSGDEETGEGLELEKIKEGDSGAQVESSEVKEYLDTRALVSSQGRIVEKVARSLEGETEDIIKRNLIEKGQGTKS
jgi:hypothetical protein